MNKKADVEMRDDQGRTALHFAAQQDQEAICRALMDAGGDITALDDRGVTPVAVAGEGKAGRALRGLQSMPDELEGLFKMKTTGGMGREDFLALMGVPKSTK